MEQGGEGVDYKYATGQIGEIDLLAKRRPQPRWRVIELKRNQTSDIKLGQVLRYVGGVDAHLAAEGEAVEGMIIAHSGEERIRYALKHTSGVSLRLQEIDFRRKKAGE